MTICVNHNCVTRMTEFPIWSKLRVDLDRATYPCYFLKTPSFRGASSSQWPSVSANFLTTLFPSRGTGSNSMLTWLVMPTTETGQKAHSEKREKHKYNYKSYWGPSQVGVVLWNSSSLTKRAYESTSREIALILCKLCISNLILKLESTICVIRDCVTGWESSRFTTVLLQDRHHPSEVLLSSSSTNFLPSLFP